MPEISRFYGIVVKMYFGDHPPPHFHAEYAEDTAVVNIRTLFPLRSGSGRRKAMVRSSALSEKFTARPGVSTSGSNISGARGSVSVVVAPTGEVDGRIVAKIGIGVPGQDPINGKVLPQLSPRGDRVYYSLQRRRTSEGPWASDAGSIWVVSVDGGDARKVATAEHIVSATWDPTGRYIAYTAEGVGVDDETVLRVVEIETGRAHEIPMEKASGRIVINDWSKDGRHIGMVRVENWWEYWAVQGLEDAGL